MSKTHTYQVAVKWTGNLGSGTSGYRDYNRNHEVNADGKAAAIAGSSDPKFRGDRSRYNPEELLVAALSSCHMLWVLHLCADGGITVIDYHDRAVGTMAERADGGGEFTSVTLQPQLTVRGPDRKAEVDQIHEKAHSLCFIARSVNFPVRVEPGAKFVA